MKEKILWVVLVSTIVLGTSYLCFREYVTIGNQSTMYMMVFISLSLGLLTLQVSLHNKSFLLYGFMMIMMPLSLIITIYDINMPSGKEHTFYTIPDEYNYSYDGTHLFVKDNNASEFAIVKLNKSELYIKNKGACDPVLWLYVSKPKYNLLNTVYYSAIINCVDSRDFKNLEDLTTIPLTDMVMVYKKLRE